MELEFWLISTDHLKDRLWFKDDDDFKAGMNVVAILAATMPMVNILPFILMSNHVHFIVEGGWEDAQVFIDRYKKIYGQRYRKKYGVKEPFRHIGTDIRALSLSNEGLERGIAYVQMNAVGANICLTASDYRWGTGNLFFRDTPVEGVALKSLSKRAQRRSIGSKISLPGNYILNRAGFIDPSSYISTAFVESLFRTPKRMKYFLDHSSKAKLVREAPSFNDQLVLSALKELCKSLFRIEKLAELQPSQQAEILKQVRYRFSASPEQIARIAELPYETTCALLENFS